MLQQERRGHVTSNWRSLFNGRSTIARRDPTLTASPVHSPKSPAPRLGIAILTSPTISIPGVTGHRVSTADEVTSPAATGALVTSPQGTNGSPTIQSSESGPPPRPQQPHLPSPRLEENWFRHDRGISGRRQHAEKFQRTALKKGGRPHSNKKRFLSRCSGRLKLFRCLGTGVALFGVLGVYSGLVLSGKITSLNIHILMACLGLLLMMAFIYSAIRLYLYIHRPPKYPTTRITSHTIVAPEESIPVILGRDEEEASTGRATSNAAEGALAAPPPAYGMWRGSTRMDPTLVHWQRVDNFSREAISPQGTFPVAPRPAAEHQPPTYTSEDRPCQNSI